MKVIAISGTPGTGKTTLARKLSKKIGYKYIDVNDIIKKYNISEGYDKKRKCMVIDTKNLNKFLVEKINHYKKLSLKNKLTNKKSLKCQKSKISEHAQKPKVFDKIKNKINGLIIDSHLSHYLPNRYVDLCIITKCDLKELQRRLKKKSYNKEKIRENIDCEIFDICLNEAKENSHKIMVVNTTKGININSLLAKIR